MQRLSELETISSVDLSPLTRQLVDELNVEIIRLGDDFYNPRCSNVGKQVRQVTRPIFQCMSAGSILALLEEISQKGMLPFELSDETISLLWELSEDASSLTYGKIAPLVGWWQRTLLPSDTLSMDMTSLVFPKFMCQSGRISKAAFCSFGLDDFYEIQDELLYASTLPKCVGERKLISLVTQFLRDHLTLVIRGGEDIHQDMFEVVYMRLKLIAYMQCIMFLMFKCVGMCELTKSKPIANMAESFQRLLNVVVVKSKERSNVWE